MRKVMVGLLALLAISWLLVGTARADSGFTLSAPAISGDFCYDIMEGKVGYGPSYCIGTFGLNQMMEIRGQWVIFPDTDVPNKLGAGVSVSLPKLLVALGVKNLPEWFNTSVGVLALIDFSVNPELSLGAYATLIKIPF